MAVDDFEMLLMRNAHTPYTQGTKQKASELGPISETGIGEAVSGASYLTSILGARSLKFYASPLTRRAKDTALQTAGHIQQNGAPMPTVHELFIVPEDMQPVGYLPPDEVAQREYEAMLTLESHLGSLGEIINGKAIPVIVMSGRAIWLAFGQKLSDWPTLGEKAIPTGAIIHPTRDKYKGFMPVGHKADNLSEYFEQLRAK